MIEKFKVIQCLGFIKDLISHIYNIIFSYLFILGYISLYNRPLKSHTFYDPNGSYLKSLTDLIITLC